MTTAIWLYVALRLAICLVAGETFVRYAGWFWWVWRSREKLTITPIIIGVAAMSFWRFNIEGRWATLLLDPHVAAKFQAIDGTEFWSQMSRLGQVLSFLYLSYPVTRLHYGTTKERALVEMFVRFFLIVISIGIGCVVTTIYYFHP